MTTDKEQRLESAIIKILRDEGISFRPSNTYSDVKDVAFEAIKSDAAREYWQSQKQETPELEDLRIRFRKEFDYFTSDKCKEDGRDAIFNFFAKYIKGTEWIDCKERMPKYLEEVLTIDDSGKQRVLELQDWESGNEIEGYKSGEYWTDTETNTDYELSEIIKWQPLPKAPKEVTND